MSEAEVELSPKKCPRCGRDAHFRYANAEAAAAQSPICWDDRSCRRMTHDGVDELKPLLQRARKTWGQLGPNGSTLAFYETKGGMVLFIDSESGWTMLTQCPSKSAVEVEAELELVVYGIAARRNRTPEGSVVVDVREVVEVEDPRLAQLYSANGWVFLAVDAETVIFGWPTDRSDSPWRPDETPTRFEDERCHGLPGCLPAWLVELRAGAIAGSHGSLEELRSR